MSNSPDRFDCDMLCRTAGVLDSFSSHEPDEAAKLRLKRMAEEVFAAAVWLRLNNRDSSLDPQPAPPRTSEYRLNGKPWP